MERVNPTKLFSGALVHTPTNTHHTHLHVYIHEHTHIQIILKKDWSVILTQKDLQGRQLNGQRYLHRMIAKKTTSVVGTYTAFSGLCTQWAAPLATWPMLPQAEGAWCSASVQVRLQDIAEAHGTVCRNSSASWTWCSRCIWYHLCLNPRKQHID